MVERRTSTGLETPKAPHVLVVAGDAALGARLSEVLGRRGFELTVVTEPEEAVRGHRQDGADLVIAALPLAGADARELITALRAHDPRLPFILTGQDPEVAGAVEAFELGALDYVGDSAERHAGAARRDRDRARHAPRRRAPSLSAREGRGRRDLAGARPVRGDAAGVRGGRADLPPHPGGEHADHPHHRRDRHRQGAARQVHPLSQRAPHPAFVGVNCAALPPSLIEAELFGYDAAPSPARTPPPGLFETAHAGTLFLDEIGALPIELQAKLLSALEEQRVRRIGGRSSLAVDVQVVAATHRDLARRSPTASFAKICSTASTW